jgi:APA family basic amino acid/polyamine antiporter
VLPIAVILPGDVTFVGTLYSFGATLSFTVAHASVIRMRMRPSGELQYRARPNLRLWGVDWPLFAIFGGIATGVSFAVIVVQNATTRWVGLGWIAFGFVLYAVYRRRFVRAPLTATVKAPPAYGPALALEYRRLLVPVLPGRASDDALDIAASLAAERGAQIAAVTVLEIPLDLPLGVELPVEEEYANRELDEARAIGASYGISVIPRLIRGRNAGAAIVQEAERRGSEIIVIGAPRKDLSRRKRAVFGHTVDYVLKHAPCRVMVAAQVAE